VRGVADDLENVGNLREGSRFPAHSMYQRENVGNRRLGREFPAFSRSLRSAFLSQVVFKRGR